MNTISNHYYKFLTILLISIVSAYASGYEEYRKELGELKVISIEALSKNPAVKAKVKSEYNELAHEVNKYIYYFIQIIDEKVSFNLSETEVIIKSINQKVDNLKNKLKVKKNDKKLEAQAFVNPRIVLSVTLLTIQATQQLYELCKELKKDYEKYRMKKELTSYKWEYME